MNRTKATYAAIFGIASLLGLGSSAEANQMVFRPAPMPVQTFRPAPQTFRSAPVYQAPTFRSVPTYHAPTFHTAPTVRFTPRTFGTFHQSSHSRTSKSAGSRLVSKPVSHPFPSLDRQHRERIYRPSVNVPHPSTAGRNPGLGLNVKPPFPSHPLLIGPHLHPHPRPGLLYPYPWAGQPGTAASEQQLAQPDQPQDNGETAQEDPAQSTQEDAAQATQDDTAQTEEQPADSAQEQPAQAAVEQYAQASQAQPGRSAQARRRPVAERARTVQGQPRQSREEAAQMTDDETGQTIQEAPEQTAEEDHGQNAQEQGQMAGEAFGYNEPSVGLYMTEE